MRLSRREFLATGAMLASCESAPRTTPSTAVGALDQLLLAHAEVLPERAGAGANHYPMAAEALAAMGHEGAIEESWRRGAANYGGELRRIGSLADAADAFGAYERLGDLLDYFRGALQSESWRSVVGRWVVRLAPGLAGAAFHGVIRTGHAVRAMRVQDTAARRGELAMGLAYWAARYTELPTTTNGHDGPRSLLQTLQGLQHPWLDDRQDVDFFAVLDRMTQRDAPIAPPMVLAPKDVSPAAELDSIVHAAAAAVLEMLVLEQQRLWLMHTVTGSAAVGLLLPEVDDAGARALVGYARQAVIAFHVAYGAPFTARAHLRPSPPTWPDLIERAAASRSVHTIKLIEALSRFDVAGDPLCRTVAVQWLEWV